MKTISRLLILGAFILAMVPKAVVKAQTPADEIKQWTAAFTTNPDGSLHVRYDIAYTASTTFPSAELNIAAPQSNVTLNDAGSSIGNDHHLDGVQMYVNFDHTPQAGESFTVFYDFTVQDMANKSGDSINWEYTSPPLDFARIQKFLITWQLPSDSTLVQTLNPAPASQADGTATWEFDNVEENQTVDVQVQTAASAYPDVQAVPAPAPAPQEPSGTTDNSGGGLTILGLLIIVFLVLVGIVIVCAIVSYIAENFGTGSSDSGSDDSSPSSYTGGISHTSSYHDSGSSIFSHEDSAPSPSYSPPSSIGGGDSGFGGRSASCACVSACACACAGGSGRLGCAAKGFKLTAPSLMILIGKKPGTS